MHLAHRQSEISGLGWIIVTNRAWSYVYQVAFLFSLELVVPEEEIERGQHAPMQISNDHRDRFDMGFWAYLTYEACLYQQGMCVLYQLR